MCPMPIKTLRLGILAVAGAALAVTPAAAQGTGFVGGLGGVTFNTVSSGIFAGQAGVHLGRGLFLIGEVGRAQNVLPTEIADQLRDAEEFIEDQVGLPVRLRVRVPATYGFGGVRWVLPDDTRRVRPFLEGAGGLAHLTAKLRLTVGGVPVPDDFVQQFDDFDLEMDEFLLALGGGVNLELARVLSMDVGYRYMRVFVEDEAPSVHTSVVYAAVKVAFGR